MAQHTSPASPRRTREAMVKETRSALVTTAERLFAENGVMTVSNRQVSAEAGLGNNTAVNYHFGTKADLVRAIVVSHQADIADRRAEQLQRASGSDIVRDWVECLVLPTAAHLAALGTPSYYARFSAQLIAEPSLAPIVEEEALGGQTLTDVLEGLHACLPTMPEQVRIQRGQMSRQLIVHGYAERESALANRHAAIDWDQYATILVDAVTGLWTAVWTQSA